MTKYCPHCGGKEFNHCHQGLYTDIICWSCNQLVSEVQRKPYSEFLYDDRVPGCDDIGKETIDRGVIP